MSSGKTDRNIWAAGNRMTRVAVLAASVVIPYGMSPARAAPASEPSATHADAVPISDAKSAGASGSVQGPATEVPREVLDMLENRKRFLDKKEEALRVKEERFLVLKHDIEQLLDRYEKAVKVEEMKRNAAEARRKAAEEKLANSEGDAKRAAQAQLVKMYEAMAPEDAAARLEKMPDKKALELLRLLKGKTAGAILAAVKPVQAAKLTEHLIESGSKGLGTD